MSDFPRWLEPVIDAADEITVSDLTQFAPPEDGESRQGAVLMVFADRALNPADELFGDPDPDDDESPLSVLVRRGELLLTERAHHMRSHPGQVSFPGGGLDAGETVVEGALREAFEEIGMASDSVAVFGELPQLFLPPSNFAVTPVLAWWRERTPVHAASPDEVHAIHHVAISDLLDPANRFTVVHPIGWRSPAFFIGDDLDVVLWGFTAGIIGRFFDFLGIAGEWDASREIDLPTHMLRDLPSRTADLLPNLRRDEDEVAR